MGHDWIMTPFETVVFIAAAMAGGFVMIAAG
jgi:hypothetical protein